MSGMLFTQIVKQWLRLFKTGVSQIMKHYVMPKTIFIFETILMLIH